MLILLQCEDPCIFTSFLFGNLDRCTFVVIFLTNVYNNNKKIFFLREIHKIQSNNAGNAAIHDATIGLSLEFTRKFRRF